MQGHGQKLTRKKEALIAALLTEKTQAAAAAKTGVSEIAMYRWLRRPDFLSDYRAARRRVVEAAVARLQQATGQAVSTLVELLAATQPPAVRCRAAEAILDKSTAAVELIDLAERVEELELRLPELPKRPHRAG